MSKINQFDRQTLRALRVDLDAAMASIATKYGIQLNAGNISYTAETATIKVQAGVINKSGQVVTKDAQAFNKYKRLVGLGNLNVGDVINIQGKEYTISGYKPRSKNAVIVQRDGRGYKVSVEMVKMYNSQLV